MDTSLFLLLLPLLLAAYYLYSKSKATPIVVTEEKEETESKKEKQESNAVKKENSHNNTAHKGKSLKEESSLRIGALKGHTQTVTSSAVSPDGHLAATSSQDQTIKMWDVRVLKEEGNYK